MMDSRLYRNYYKERGGRVEEIQSPVSLINPYFYI